MQITRAAIKSHPLPLLRAATLVETNTAYASSPRCMLFDNWFQTQPPTWDFKNDCVCKQNQIFKTLTEINKNLKTRNCKNTYIVFDLVMPHHMMRSDCNE